MNMVDLMKIFCNVYCNQFNACIPQNEFLSINSMILLPRWPGNSISINHTHYIPFNHSIPFKITMFQLACVLMFAIAVIVYDLAVYLAFFDIPRYHGMAVVA